jgi:hypothetical protein
MKRLNCVALTEKGALVSSVRKAVNGMATEHANSLVEQGWVHYADKNAWALPIEDTNGNVIYATLTLTIGSKAPNEKAEKKAKPRATAPAEPVEITD